MLQFTFLPTEIQLLIGSMSSTPKDYVSLARCNKYLHATMSSPINCAIHLITFFDGDTGDVLRFLLRRVRHPFGAQILNTFRATTFTTLSPSDLKYCFKAAIGYEIPSCDDKNAIDRLSSMKLSVLRALTFSNMDTDDLIEVLLRYAIQSQDINIVISLVDEFHLLNRNLALSYSQILDTTVDKFDVFELLLNRGMRFIGSIVSAAVSIAATDNAKLLRAFLDNLSRHSLNELDIAIDTAWSLAAYNGHKNVIQCLLHKYHANPSRDDNIAARWCYRKGYHSILELLIAYGLGVAGGVDDGFVPYYLAIKHEHCEVVRVLLNHGAEITHHAVEVAKATNNPELIELLVAKTRQLITVY